MKETRRLFVSVLTATRLSTITYTDRLVPQDVRINRH